MNKKETSYFKNPVHALIFIITFLLLVAFLATFFGGVILLAMHLQDGDTSYDLPDSYFEALTILFLFALLTLVIFVIDLITYKINKKKENDSSKNIFQLKIDKNDSFAVDSFDLKEPLYVVEPRKISLKSKTLLWGMFESYRVSLIITLIVVSVALLMSLGFFINNHEAVGNIIFFAFSVSIFISTLFSIFVFTPLLMNAGINRNKEIGYRLYEDHIDSVSYLDLEDTSKEVLSRVYFDSCINKAKNKEAYLFTYYAKNRKVDLFIPLKDLSEEEKAFLDEKIK